VRAAIRPSQKQASPHTPYPKKQSLVPWDADMTKGETTTTFHKNFKIQAMSGIVATSHMSNYVTGELQSVISERK
jgi:hypothetical protein